MVHNYGYFCNTFCPAPLLYECWSLCCKWVLYLIHASVHIPVSDRFDREPQWRSKLERRENQTLTGKDEKDGRKTSAKKQTKNNNCLLVVVFKIDHNKNGPLWDDERFLNWIELNSTRKCVEMFCSSFSVPFTVCIICMYLIMHVTKALLWFTFWILCVFWAHRESYVSLCNDQSLGLLWDIVKSKFAWW